MRRILRITLLLATLLCSVAAPAQQRKEQRPKPSKTEMAQKQATRIADELALSDETRDRFIATFVNCQQEMWNLHKAHKKGKNDKSLTEAQTDSLIRARFDHSQRTLDLRRRYYDEYRKFLTARQVNRVYELERAMMKHLNGKRKAPADCQKPAKPQKPSRPCN